MNAFCCAIESLARTKSVRSIKNVHKKSVSSFFSKSLYQLHDANATICLNQRGCIVSYPTLYTDVAPPTLTHTRTHMHSHTNRYMKTRDYLEEGPYFFGLSETSKLVSECVSVKNPTLVSLSKNFLLKSQKCA